MKTTLWLAALLLISSTVEARHRAPKHAAHKQAARSKPHDARHASTKNAQAKRDTGGDPLAGLPGF